MEYDLKGTYIAAPTIQVKYLSFKFDTYDIVREDGYIYIYGKNVSYRDLGEFSISTSYRILFNMMALYSKLSVYGKAKIYQERLADYLTAEDINLILKFVKKHGFPFFGDTDNPFKNNIDCKKYRFNVGLFAFSLFQLREDFLKIIVQHKLYKSIQILNSVMTDKDKKRIAVFEEHPKLCRLHCIYYNHFELQFTSDNNFIAKTENLVHLASYYLCLMSSSGKLGGYIRQCQCCGSLFVADDARQKYCQNPCTRQNVHMKKIRKTQNH